MLEDYLNKGIKQVIEEFPELASIYDRCARTQLYQQLEDYLSTRIGQGLIRPLHSVEATARFISEGMSWFGWKQLRSRIAAPYSRADALPD